MLIQMQVKGFDGYFNTDAITRITDRKDGTTEIYFADGTSIVFSCSLDEVMKTLRRASIDVMNATLKGN